MIRYECDRCGLRMNANDHQRYIVKLEIYAAAGPVDLDPDKSASTEGNLASLIDDLAKADPDEIEDQTYRSFRFDLCDACRRELIKKPLG